MYARSNMSLLKCYKFYNLSNQNYLKEDFKSVIYFSYNCWEEIRRCFDSQDVEKQAFCLDLLFKSSLLTFKSLKLTNRREEAEVYLTKIKQNFRDISKIYNYPDATRESSKFYLRKINNESKNFMAS